MCRLIINRKNLYNTFSLSMNFVFFLYILNTVKEDHIFDLQPHKIENTTRYHIRKNHVRKKFR